MDIVAWLEANQTEFVALSNQIWDFAELKFDEEKSSFVLQEAMKKHGFELEEKVAGLDTAFIASYGSGKPIIGILAEFDALDGMSQKADVFEKTMDLSMQAGHGCGHQLFGAASVAAAIALKQYMQANNLSGTLRMYGCPGEEGGSGKTFMAREKVFDDLDACIAWHPDSCNTVTGTSSLANAQVYFRFLGKSAHAAAAPHLGRSALDSVEIMNIGVNYLREHVVPEARMHYAITNTGGKSPNVVQAEAEVLYLIRAPKTEQVLSIYNRICDIAKGAALICGTSYEVDFDKACSNLIPNDTLCEVMSEAALVIPPIAYTEEEYAYASCFYETLGEEERKSAKLTAYANLAPKECRERIKEEAKKPLISSFIPYIKMDKVMPGSTDVSDVSWITPTVQCITTCATQGTPMHSWQMVAQGKSSIAHKGMLHAAKIMAETGKSLLEKPEVIETAKQELTERLDGASYKCPIPAGIKARKYGQKPE